MRTTILIFSLTVFLASCNTSSKKSESTSDLLPLGTHKGTVSEVIQTPSYTYLLIKESMGENWIAIPKAEVKEGQQVFYDEGLEMKNFQSKTLQREFETIYFVKGIRNEALESVDEAIRKNINKSSGAAKTDIEIEQPQGAQSIAYIFENKSSLSDTKVTVKGKIVKVNNGILNTNWVHIQDGSSFENSFDLTVTTDELYQVGDVVTFIGTIGLNRDFGAGYIYNVIMEDATKVVSL
ncbi:hypothetical protein [Carboxylicivirga linearis]|uniref:GW domain-containing protein n=1 Tax=Carboxylicivirga linearis TaxID=1628157 RepID=A0ABS5JV61_9BACT|nr:hypothetical protein [Carboxylicivirga linearis]MBS2098800.1 hypothetical protein [Carboxylicivirga linearis]